MKTKAKVKAEPPAVRRQRAILFSREEVASLGMLVQHHSQDGDDLGAAARTMFAVLDEKLPQWREWTETLRHQVKP